MDKTAWVDVAQSDHALSIKIGGECRAKTAYLIDPPLRDLTLSGFKSCKIDISKITSLDITGVWIIERLQRTLKEKKIKSELVGSTDQFDSIQNQLGRYKLAISPKFEKSTPIIDWLENIGRNAEKVTLNTYRLLGFLGQVVLTFIDCIRHPRKIPFVSVVAVINRVGLNALPIVGLISFLIGVVLVYQGSYQLRKFGAEIFTVDLLAISFMREIGILLTAIVVAGRSGSAFAAEIGTMKLNQEIDALNTFGLDPVIVLVIPRVIGLVIALPLLAFFADLVGLAGGAWMSYIALDISYNQYSVQLLQAISTWTFWVGIIKAPVFGFVIALIGCFEGLQVYGGSLSVGKKTTKSVVEAIFLVIVVDAGFSILFTILDI